jgi:hypothetical protein
MLTEKQAAFVAGVVSGKSATAAAKEAGYLSDGEGWRLSRVPEIREAIQKGRCGVIETSGASLAWATVENLMKDAATPAAVRFSAARWTLEAAGVGLAARIAENGGGNPEKALNELSLKELEEFISRGREALANLKEARVIEAKPSGSEA